MELKPFPNFVGLYAIYKGDHLVTFKELDNHLAGFDVSQLPQCKNGLYGPALHKKNAVYWINGKQSDRSQYVILDENGINVLKAFMKLHRKFDGSMGAIAGLI